MDLAVYLHRSNGTVTLLGRRPTEDPRPYSYPNLALSVAITRASKLVIGKDCRLVNAVEDPLDRRRPLYQQAAPTIRYALCVTAARAHQTLPYLPPRYEGHVDGLAQALEIMLNAADTDPAPGIAWRDFLPSETLDQARRLLSPEGTPTGCWTSDSVADGEPALDVPGQLGLVEQRDREVLVGDAALPVRVDDHLVTA